MFTLKKKGKQMDKLIKNISHLNHIKLGVGHYREDGTHGDSGLTYPELLAIWAFGIANNNEGDIKDPQLQFIMQEVANGNFAKNPKIKQLFKQWGKDVLKPSANKKFIEAMGEVLVDEYKDVFGRVGEYMPAIGNNDTPMLDTEELMENTKYKITRK